jgi:hypothetical protein
LNLDKLMVSDLNYFWNIMDPIICTLPVFDIIIVMIVDVASYVVPLVLKPP